ncbi:hypothetical protein [Limosilactobacillus fermentum]|uniref:hypothetical protein n=1 Tax=Limosilactobacillus fermentum TaxID=1613 RepID=UPI003365AC15
MLVKVTLQSDADDYRDLLVANLKQDGAGLKDFPRQGFTPMYKEEDLKLGDWVLVPFQAHGEAEKILPAVVIEIVDKPEASFSFKIKEVFATFTPSSATIKETGHRRPLCQGRTPGRILEAVGKVPQVSQGRPGDGRTGQAVGTTRCRRELGGTI